MLSFAIYFRYEEDGFTSEIIDDSSDWTETRHLPRIADDLYLGNAGMGFSWYTVKSVRWFDSFSVTLVVHNKRDKVAE